jgi:hypothetical protein
MKGLVKEFEDTYEGAHDLRDLGWAKVGQKT